MRKFLILFVMLVATMSTNAQNLEASKWYEDTYIGVSGGVFGWVKPEKHNFDNFKESLRGDVSIRIGKNINPKFGLEIEDEVGMGYQSTFVDHNFLSINMLFNVNNMIHQYKGIPDKVEFIPLVGVGWHHTFNNINNIASKFGCKIDFNIGKKRAWQINLIPSINYILTDNGFASQPTSQPRFDINRSYVNVQLGCTYKFKNRKNTHNFVISPYTHTDMDMKKILQDLMFEQERNRSLVKELSNKSISRDSDTIQKTVILSSIGFQIGKSDISPVHRGSILQLANYLKSNNVKVLIKGFADKNTGTKERNLQLSKDRSINVYNELIKLGVSEDKISNAWVGSDEQLFNENDANRVVIFIIK